MKPWEILDAAASLLSENQHNIASSDATHVARILRHQHEKQAVYKEYEDALSEIYQIDASYSNPSTLAYAVLRFQRAITAKNKFDAES